MKCTEKISYEDFSRLLILVNGTGEQTVNGDLLVGTFCVPEANDELDDGTLYLEEYNDKDKYNELEPILLEMADALGDSHCVSNPTMVAECEEDNNYIWIVLGISVVSLGIYLYYKKRNWINT